MHWTLDPPNNSPNCLIFRDLLRRFFAAMFQQSIVLAFIINSGLVAATCECGYQTNTDEVWQYSIVTDFNTTDTTTFSTSADWTIVDSVHANGTTHPYTLAYTGANVVVQDSTLQLTCSAYESSPNKTIYAGEIITKRSDILYGSFRSSHRVEGGAGAVAALFFYADDADEIDIELVTDDHVRDVHFTNQPDGLITTYMPNGASRTTFASYRFDWLPSQTSFYVNDVLSGSLTDDVPAINGSIELNSWANGGSFTGSQVPTTDSVMSVQWIKLYFNTSSSSSAESWESNCEAAGVAVCLVDAGTIGSNQTSTQTSSASSIRGASWWWSSLSSWSSWS